MKTPYEPMLYRSPIDLPRSARGTVSVEHVNHPAGATLPIIGLREAIMSGIAPVMAKLPEPMRVHVLRDADGIWMKDDPQELNQIAAMLHDVEPYGRVVVGGLGLGVVAASLANVENIDEIIVVENDPDVIALCGRAVEFGYKIVEADIFDWLCNTLIAADFYLLDTWRGTNESTWWDTVLPLRRLIRNQYGDFPVIHCWAEDQMLGTIGAPFGQIYHSLTTSPEPHWYYEMFGDALPLDVPTARTFVETIGTEPWEQRWGAAVDAVLAKYACDDRPADYNPYPGDLIAEGS